jgi:hypothetical protein
MMGFFKDIHKLNQQAKEIDKTWDPGAQARDTLAQMKAMNESMAQATQAMTDGVPGTAQVVTVSPATGMVNFNPTMRVELLVSQQGGPPRPVTKDLVVPVVYVSRVYPGANLAVMVSASDPEAVAIMWDAPVV